MIDRLQIGEIKELKKPSGNSDSSYGRTSD